MKKNHILIIGILFFLGISCSKNLTDLNTETKRPAVATGGTLFANATKALSDNLASASVNINPLRYTLKHWAATTYQDEPRFDFFTRNIPTTWWRAMYRDVLIDLKEATRYTSADLLLEPIKKNRLAIIDIMEVYTWSILVNTFGDIPYSKALDIAGNQTPEYDDAAGIFKDLMNRLDADIKNIDTTQAGFTSLEDLVYKGRMGGWLMFANGLKLKLGMIIADVDPAASKAAVEAADQLAIAKAGDNALFVYLEASPNKNPLNVDIIDGNRGDYVASKDLMDYLITLNDPRKSLYFKPNNNGVYAGGIVGSGNTLADMSQPSSRLTAPTAPLIFMDVVEMEFLRAEAKERGYNVAGTAADHYANAIKASIQYWGGSSSDADAYLSNSNVAYATAAGDWKQKIGFQKWIGLYNRPFDGWVEIRRLDNPVLSPPVSAVSGFPVRYLYPSIEQSINRENYTKAAAKIGGDNVATKLFWDKN